MCNVNIVGRSVLSAIFAVILLSACGSASSPTVSLAQTDDTPTPSNPSNPSNPTSRRQVLSGWISDYSEFIEEKVSDVYPALLSISNARMATLCPNWGALDRGRREKFWSALLYGIASRESGHKRTSIYRETTMSTDAVTGLQIRSEGLLQLSYVDVRNYRYSASGVSWAHDREMALADYASGTKSGNPKRTILDAYANLDLGLFIMNRLAATRGSEMLEAAYGRYWSTMRVGGRSFPFILSSLKSRIPDCF